MALATNPIDTNRKSENVQLPAQLSTEIWSKTIENSAVMTLAQRVNLPGSGITIPVITGDATADWVAETAEKPVSKSSFGVKQMTPYKMAVIELFSNEFRRDLPALYGELERRLPLSLGKKLDETVFNGTAPGTNFDVLSGSASVALDLADAYGSLVGVYETLATADASLTGWAMSPQGKAILLSAVDGTKRPLFVPNVNDTNVIGRILGAPVTETKSVYAQGTPNTVGFAGDWEQARYGIVDGINIAISDEATINDGEQQINLWQRNMFAIRVEAEFGFVVKDPAAFVKITAAGE